MNKITSPFYSDSIKLSWKDIVILIFGGKINGSGVVVGLWSQPDNGSPGGGK